VTDYPAESLYSLKKLRYLTAVLLKIQVPWDVDAV